MNQNYTVTYMTKIIVYYKQLIKIFLTANGTNETKIIDTTKITDY